jgi:EmrB/QacA subfamily drug resistance transporter
MSLNKFDPQAKMKTTAQKWLPLVILTLALAIVVIDSTVFNVSLREIITDLKTDYQTVQWAITLYTLVAGSFTIVGGRLGDLFGRKKMFMLGAFLFGIGSLTAALSTNIQTLIIGWSLIEGIGAALMMPSTSALTTAIYTGKDRAIAFGFWGASAGLASVIGPILGGYLTTYFSWHWAFGINLFIVAIILLGTRIIPESRELTKKPELDWGGVFLSIFGIASLIYGIIESTSYGWIKAKKDFMFMGEAYSLNGLSISFYSLILGFILIGIFVWYESKREKNGHLPLVSVSLFSNLQFTIGLLTNSVFTMAQSGFFIVLPLFLATVLGLDALHVGLSLIPLSLALLIAVPLGGFLVRSISTKYLIITGTLISMTSIPLLYWAFKSDTTTWDFVPGLFVFGIGFGLIVGQLSNLILSSVKIERIGEASGVNAMMRNVAATFGTALIGAIFFSGLTTNFATQVNKAQINPVAGSTKVPEVLQEQIGVEFRKTIITQFEDQVENGGSSSNPETTNFSDKLSNQIKDAIDETFASSARDTQIYIEIFLLVSLLISFGLPKNKLGKT